MKFYIYCLIYLIVIAGICYPLIGGEDFERSLFSSIEKNCKNQNECIIDLHQILPFEWDEVYIFQKASQDYIQKITGLSNSFETDITDIGEQIVFIKNHQLIAYKRLINDDYLHNFDVIPSFVDLKHLFVSKKNVGVTFLIDEANNKKIFSYYLITLNNSKLKVKKYISQDKSQETYIISPTNLDQVKLFNPKIDNH